MRVAIICDNSLLLCKLPLGECLFLLNIWDLTERGENAEFKLTDLNPDSKTEPILYFIHSYNLLISTSLPWCLNTMTISETQAISRIWSSATDKYGSKEEGSIAVRCYLLQHNMTIFCKTCDNCWFHSGQGILNPMWKFPFSPCVLIQTLVCSITDVCIECYSVYQFRVSPAHIGTTVLDPNPYSFGTFQLFLIKVVLFEFLGRP